MTDLNAVPVFSVPSPRVRRIAPDRPWAWLQQGFQDLIRTWRVSLAYGAILVGFSWVLTAILTGTGYFHLLLPMCAGFMVVAPLAAVGLYEASRRLGTGEPVSLRTVMGAFTLSDAKQIGFMGAVLLLIWIFWIRVAILLYALFFNELNPSLDNLIQTVFTSAVSLPFLIVGTIIGGILAAVTYAISAISIPMLLDRDTNVFTAIATSIMAVRENMKPMLLWAFIIVFCSAVGMVTLFLGLAVMLPLIGHATWHAYKDLVAD